MTARRLRDLKLCALAVAVMAVLALVHLVASDVPWLRTLELAALDAQIRWRSRLPPGPETVIVMIDDATIAELGWPVPRRSMAELVATLRLAEVRVIGIDVLFADRERTAPGAGAGRIEPTGDIDLAEAMRTAGNVVLPFAFTFGGRTGVADALPAVPTPYPRLQESRSYRPLALRPTGILTPLPSLAEPATLGHMLVAFDVDGAPRYDYPALDYDVDFYPSMAIRIVQRYLHVPWTSVGVELGRGIAVGRLYVPTDAHMRMLVNYLGPARTFPTYSLSQVLSGKVASSAFRDRIVLVGADALGTRDTFQSPFTAVMPGVERLASVVDSMLHDRHLRRPAAAPWLEIAFMLVAAVVLAFAVSRLGLAAASLCGLGLVVLTCLSAHFALSRYGIWQASAVPGVAIVACFIALSLYRYGLLDKERRHIRHVFQRYLAPRMVDRLAESPKLPELGGELRELTVLFCDLRGFTTLSEHLDPGTLTRTVNGFFDAASDAILEQGGTIDKYIGDAIMAFWNAPIDQRDHCALACRAALSILAKVDEFNATLRDEAAPRLAVGIGINTGPCTVGNFGSRHRFDYSAIGDTVNVAARLEGETKTYRVPIILGAATAARVSEFATLPVGRILPRGRSEPMDIHALAGDEDARDSGLFRELHAMHLEWQAASAAGDVEAARHAAQWLATHAPAELRGMYETRDRDAQGSENAHATSS